MRASDGRDQTMLADIRRSRVLFVLLAGCLTAFGLLMIYSASSIMALTSNDYGNNPAYFLIRQAIFAGVGAVLAAAIGFFDYHHLSRTFYLPAWLGTLCLLAAVLTSAAGADAYGATRWISVGPVHLQPSEFAKAVLLLGSAAIIEDYMVGGQDTKTCIMRAAGLIAIPLLLILRQPDKGTVLIIVLTIGLMLYMAGLPLQYVVGGIGVALCFIMFLAFKDEYSRQRIMVMRDPWLDEYGAGYQLIQGLYAFGGGGLFGVGIGNSRQKYSYLPMAHNDFIYAVIGEELGLLGTVAVLAAFFGLVYLGFKIAKSAPDLSGRLIAAGSVSMLAIQLLVNVCGVLGIIPLSGKPIPFLSYGGSSIMATLVLVGLVVSVSRVAERECQSARGGFTVYEGARGGLRVVEGGRSTSRMQTRDERPSRSTGTANPGMRASREFSYGQAVGGISLNPYAQRRIDLGPSSTERLRRR